MKSTEEVQDGARFGSSTLTHGVIHFPCCVPDFHMNSVPFRIVKPLEMLLFFPFSFPLSPHHPLNHSSSDALVGITIFRFEETISGRMTRVALESLPMLLPISPPLIILNDFKFFPFSSSFTRFIPLDFLQLH